jgi:hypothetical protein
MLAGLALLSLLATAPDSVLLGVRVTPDTVTIGSPFQVLVRVRAPRGARIEFSLGPDSTGGVQALDTRRVVDSPDTTGTEAMATYRLAAWDVGEQAVVIPNAMVRLPGTLAVRPVPIGPLSVFVRRLVPPQRDSAKRSPKPARPILAIAEPWWMRWAIAFGALVVLLLLLWWLVRRARRHGLPGVRLDPYSEAVTELDRIERLGLLDAGERGRYVALVTQVVRDYLAGRIASADLSLTTGELLQALSADARVPLDRLRSVLEESDLVKFARARVTTERAAEVASDARQVVEQTDSAVRAAEAKEAAA